MHLRHSLLFLSVLGALFSCGEPDTEEGEEIVITSEKEESLEGLVQNAILSQRDWVQSWAQGQLDPARFEFTRVDSIPTFGMPERNPILKGDPLFPYQFVHPTGQGVMDIYSSTVEARRGSKEAFMNPDSKVIWYGEDGMKETLLLIGPSGSFLDGDWISETEFLVVGTLLEEEGHRPVSWLLDMGERLVYQYQWNELVKGYSTKEYLDSRIKEVNIR